MFNERGSARENVEITGLVRELFELPPWLSLAYSAKNSAFIQHDRRTKGVRDLKMALDIKCERRYNSAERLGGK